jgi:hypothetical protein
VGSYSFHYISRGRIQKTEEKTFPDDLDAVEAAEKLAREGEVVIWDGHRYVARVKQSNTRPGLNESPG